MNLENVKSRGDHFIPTSVGVYMGERNRIHAAVKRDPRDFIVEEQTTDHHRCSTAPTSDLKDLFDNGGSGDIVAVTLVKKRLVTPAAIDLLRRMLPSGARITYAGLKDRWAVTSQRITISGVSYDDVVRACMPSNDQLNSEGWYIKDPIRVARMLDIGHLVGNNFNIRVSVKGYSAQQLSRYMELSIAELERGDHQFPNAFGRQRLGKRQNLFGVGYDFIHYGAEAGIERFITETSPAENNNATDLRRRLAVEWDEAKRSAKATGTCVAQQTEQLERMRRILTERTHGRPAFESLNMTIEHRIIEQLIRHGDYAKVMRSIYKDFSLWVGAYQGFWFNQVLAGVIEGRVSLEEQQGEKRIPLIIDEPRAVKFYRRWCPEAIPTQIDPTVGKLFLTPRNRHQRGPRRPVFVPVRDLSYTCEDEAVVMSFQLRSGAYATTFLSTLFELEGDQSLLTGDAA